MDWSTAPQGYISFTAVGSKRVFVLQGPNGIQDSFTAAKGETVKAILMDGTGTYQYVIGHSTADKSGYYVDYKNSFTFGKLTAIISDQFTAFFE